MINSGSICVVCAEDRNEIGEHVLQLLTKARHLYCEGGGEVTAICVGRHITERIETLFLYGAHKVISSQKAPLNRFEFANIVASILSHCNPELILFPASDWGETCAAEMAIHLCAGLTANCMDISVVNNKYVFTRAAINGTIFAQISTYNTNIAICTIPRNTFSKQKFLLNQKKNVLVYDDNEDFAPCRLNILEIKPLQELNRITILDHAKIVFGFGRGLGEGETLQLLRKVAKKYNAEIVGTKAVYDDGLIEKNRQVGQSGITIAPLIYVAFGISGASQHMVGVMNAKRIIAINIDPTAPIIRFSNEVIIEDCKNVLQNLDKLKIDTN